MPLPPLPPHVGFDFQPRTRIVFGPGSIDRLGELARELGARRALLVTDPGIVQAGHAERGCRSLQAAGVECAVFDRVHENPTTEDVDACVEAAREAGIDFFVAVGGGSSMDTAKGGNFVLTNGGRMQDYWGIGKAGRPMLPLIAVPTTAGTGSECQSFALIADAETHQKMACGDPKAAPRVALLDPVLTLSQPRSVTAWTGLDAVVHAVETAVTRKRNELSVLFAREAFRLTANNLQEVLEHPDDLHARAEMQLGAAYAGIAIENSMLGAAHSAANPLTAHFGIVHGHAVGAMLPHVVRFNAEEPAAQQGYLELMRHAFGREDTLAPARAVETLVMVLEMLLAAASEGRTLAEDGVTEAAVPQLAKEASEQWTARYNPREIHPADFEALYRAAVAG